MKCDMALQTAELVADVSYSDRGRALPIEIVQLIAQKLAVTVKLGGVRGPSVVAKDLASFANVGTPAWIVLPHAQVSRCSAGQHATNRLLLTAEAAFVIALLHARIAGVSWGRCCSLHIIHRSYGDQPNICKSHVRLRPCILLCIACKPDCMCHHACLQARRYQFHSMLTTSLMHCSHLWNALLSPLNANTGLQAVPNSSYCWICHSQLACTGYHAEAGVRESSIQKVSCLEVQ